MIIYLEFDSFFQGLIALRRLDLSSNYLTMLGDGTFSEMPNLDELLVEKNQLEFLNPGALRGLLGLSRLSLAGNRLSTLPIGLLEDKPMLRYLNLRDNRLHTFTYNNIAPVIHNMANHTAYLLLEGKS